MREPSEVFVAAIHNFPAERGGGLSAQLKVINFTKYTKGQWDVSSEISVRRTLFEQAKETSQQHRHSPAPDRGHRPLYPARHSRFLREHSGAAGICGVEEAAGGQTRTMNITRAGAIVIRCARPVFAYFFFRGPLGLEVGLRSSPFRKWVRSNLSKKTNNPNPSPIGKRFGLYGFGASGDIGFTPKS